MFIREMTGYKQNPHYQKAANQFATVGGYNQRIGSLTEFQKYLMSVGFKPLGSGQGGVVFEKPDYPYAFKIFSDDPAYKDYLLYAIGHQDNIHVPKIKGKMIRINEHTFVARIEKLQNPSGDDFEQVMSEYSSVWEYDDLLTVKLHFTKDKFPQLYNLIMDLGKKFPDYILDLHRGNFMMRSGTIVLIDPLLEEK